jgi:hypothetical protein
MMSDDIEPDPDNTVGNLEYDPLARQLKYLAADAELIKRAWRAIHCSRALLLKASHYSGQRPDVPSDPIGDRARRSLEVAVIPHKPSERDRAAPGLNGGAPGRHGDPPAADPNACKRRCLEQHLVGPPAGGGGASRPPDNRVLGSDGDQQRQGLARALPARSGDIGGIRGSAWPLAATPSAAMPATVAVSRHSLPVANQ